MSYYEHQIINISTNTYGCIEMICDSEGKCHRKIQSNRKDEKIYCVSSHLLAQLNQSITDKSRRYHAHPFK